MQRLAIIISKSKVGNPPSESLRIPEARPGESRS